MLKSRNGSYTPDEVITHSKILYSVVHRVFTLNSIVRASLRFKNGASGNHKRVMRTPDNPRSSGSTDEEVDSPNH